MPNVGAEPRFACTTCEQRFCEVEYWVEHQSACEVDTLFNHLVDQSGENGFVCLICGQKFYHKSHLSCHFTSHKDEMSFLCKICKNEDDVKSNLEKYVLDPSNKKLYAYQINKKSLDTLHDHNPWHYKVTYICETCHMKALERELAIHARPCRNFSEICMHFKDVEDDEL